MSKTILQAHTYSAAIVLHAVPDAYAARGIAHVAQLDQTLHSAHSSDGPHGNSLRAATGMAAHRDLRVREPIIDQHHFLQSIQSCRHCS